MKFTVEEVKKLKRADDDLIAVLRGALPDGNYWEINPLDDIRFDFNCEKFGLCQCDRTGWDDQGKYQYQTEYYQLCSFNPEITKYPCEKSNTGIYDIFVSIDVTRCGSYFSEYYYEYSDIKIIRSKISHVPEVVIPAHDEVVLTEVK